MVLPPRCILSMQVRQYMYVRKYNLDGSGKKVLCILYVHNTCISMNYNIENLHSYVCNLECSVVDMYLHTLLIQTTHGVLSTMLEIRIGTYLHSICAYICTYMR